jgi:uncharacterized YigZ family protein
MNEPEVFQTIAQPSFAEFKDRGSRFLAYAYPIKSATELKEKLQLLKKEHPKAVHHCFAYRLGLDKNNFRTSDDGEPSGTAGKPILGQIDSKDLTDILIIVVRYFGGTLLGVPGLINAYKTAAALALQVTPFVQKNVTVQLKLHFDYTKMNEVMRLIKSFYCEIVSREMQLFCEMIINAPKVKLNELKNILNEIAGVEISSQY